MGDHLNVFESQLMKITMVVVNLVFFLVFWHAFGPLPFARRISTAVLPIMARPWNKEKGSGVTAYIGDAKKWSRVVLDGLVYTKGLCLVLQQHIFSAKALLWFQENIMLSFAASRSHTESFEWSRHWILAQRREQYLLENYDLDQWTQWWRNLMNVWDSV